MPALTFDYLEIAAEAKRLGLVLPKEEDFPEEDILAAMADLRQDQEFLVIATVVGDHLPATAVQTFGSLASTLGGAVQVVHNGLQAVRRATATERRRSAVQNLINEQVRVQQAAARESLQERAENQRAAAVTTA